MGRRATGDYCTGTCQVLSGTGPGGTTPQVISDPVKRREALAFTDVTAHVVVPVVIRVHQSRLDLSRRAIHTITATLNAA